MAIGGSDLLLLFAGSSPWRAGSVRIMPVFRGAGCFLTANNPSECFGMADLLATDKAKEADAPVNRTLDIFALRWYPRIPAWGGLQVNELTGGQQIILEV